LAVTGIGLSCGTPGMIGAVATRFPDTWTMLGATGFPLASAVPAIAVIPPGTR
jgi:hypothetical protein